MHKNATMCNKTLSKWCKNRHGASKTIDTFETYHLPRWKSLLMIQTLQLSGFACRRIQFRRMWKASQTQRFDAIVQASDRQVHLLIQALEYWSKVGGWVWKSTVPKDIWFPSTSGLLLAKSEKAIEFMIPMPRVPMVGTNWRGLTRQMSKMKDLGSGK
jgi:hypothetical protein